MRIFARKTEAVRVEFDEAQAFVEEHHRQGAVSQRNVTSVGLRFEGELVAVAQFCYPRTEAMKRKYSTELLRMAFRSDVRVAGGASKLVEFYKREYRPTDIFTYQDATGELTDVYEKAGFTFVSQAKKKQYLVAPGKTLATASRREALGMAYATRYGPDRILGTKLGEVHRPDGARKANAEVFIEDLGWHVEETAGDRVYEWFNRDLTFYTYKITAADSDKYYYGVSHIKKADATFEDCLNDGYYGSGEAKPGNKFFHWRTKHKNALVKEVVRVHPTKAQAFEDEKQLVGNKWQEDPKCLNSCPGGRRSAPRRTYPSSISLKECSIHGETKHRKDKCVKCTAGRLYSEQNCSTHGLTAFRNDACLKCSASSRNSIKACPAHGQTMHQGNSCLKCSAKKSFQSEECSTHGFVIHRNGVCLKCSTADNFEVRKCEIHGDVTFNGNYCVQCIAANRVASKECVVHGLTIHQGETCAKCSASRGVELASCEIHGDVLHHSGSCLTCRAEASVSKRECSLHGFTTFSGDKCRKCINQKSTNFRECPKHGRAKHQGATCSKCNVARSLSLKTCSRHGETKHQGDKCGKCTGERVAHKRFHGSKPKDDCLYCSSDSESNESSS